ncbi:caeA [Symbiodinium sp. CCMP2456]|nr:caeA [Symbiodinium sp. CCMP2456]
MHIEGYAGFSLSQRGIGVTANPSFECDPSHMKFPPKGQAKYETRYNFLEWSGTRMLAHDIDFFRSRICAPKLNLDGSSYGTAVAAVYADMFPDRVAKMVINGNMPPVPNTLEFAKGQGMALTQAFGHLERMCVKWTSTHPCDYFSNEMTLTKAWNALIGEIRAGRLTAPTNLPGEGGNVSFPLSIGLLQGYVQELMIIAGFVPTGWAKPVLTLVNLAGMRGQRARVDQVAKILDRYCTLPTGYSGEWSGVKTWRDYGACIGQQSVGLSSSESDTRLEGLGVPLRRKGSDTVLFRGVQV